jgi:hypothetical protein
MRRSGVLLALVAASAAGCGSGTPPLPPACAGGAAAIERALTRAPGTVALGDGTRLSDCVSGATDESDLEEFGAVVTQVADRLSARGADDPASALQLGYLVGAARRGAQRTNGVHAELAHRLARSGASIDAPSSVRALDRGLRAGERSG